MFFKKSKTVELGSIYSPGGAGDSGKGLVSSTQSQATKASWLSCNGFLKRLKKSKVYIMNYLDEDSIKHTWSAENVDSYVDVNLLILVNSLMLAAPASFMVGTVNMPLDAMATQIHTCVNPNATESLGFIAGLSFKSNHTADDFVIRQYNFLSSSLLTTMYAASVTIIWCIIYFVCKPLGHKPETRVFISGNRKNNNPKDDDSLMLQLGDDSEPFTKGAPTDHAKLVEAERIAFIEWWKRARYLAAMLYIGTLTSVVSLSIAVNVYYNDMVSPTVQFCDRYLDRYHNFLITISFALVSILLAFYIVL